MKPTLLISFLLCQLWLCNSSAGQDIDSIRVRNLEPYDFHLKFLKEEKAVLLDVREPFEFRKNRIADAVNAPSSSDVSALTDTLSKDTYLFVYCSTGYRSKRAAETLIQKGFINVINLDGGIVAWKKDGFPVEKKRRKTKG